MTHPPLIAFYRILKWYWFHALQLLLFISCGAWINRKIAEGIETKFQWPAAFGVHCWPVFNLVNVYNKTLVMGQSKWIRYTLERKSKKKHSRPWETHTNPHYSHIYRESYLIFFLLGFLSKEIDRRVGHLVYSTAKATRSLLLSRNNI
jgi:hypothetical protein